MLTSCGDGDVAAEHGGSGCRVALVDGEAVAAGAVVVVGQGGHAGTDRPTDERRHERRPGARPASLPGRRGRAGLSGGSRRPPGRVGGGRVRQNGTAAAAPQGGGRAAGPGPARRRPRRAAGGRVAPAAAA